MKHRWLSRSLIGLVLGAVACTAYMAYGITEEVPIGSMTGHVVMRENGRALPRAEVVLTPEKDVEDFTSTRVVRTDKEGNFRFRNLPAGHYTLEASGKAHTVKPMKIEVAEGKPSVENLACEPREPYLEMTASQKVFVPGEKLSVTLEGFGPGDQLQFRIYKIDTAKVLEKGGLQRMFSAFARAKTDGGVNPAEVASATQNFDRKIQTRDIEGVFTERPDLPALSEGFYWVQATVPNSNPKVEPTSRGTYLNVSRIGLVTKASGKELLAYVADLSTGVPVPGVKVQFYRNDKVQNEAATSSDGTLTMPMPPASPKKPGQDDDEDTGGKPDRGLVVASLDNSNAVVDFNTTAAPPSSANHIYMYTDRPIYRPGDEVHFKGIVRTLKGTDYALPGGGDAQIEIKDAGDTLVERQSLKVDGRGFFHGSFKTNKETDPGEFTVKAKALGAEHTLGVGIADYRKPEYDIKITPESTKGYTVGQKVRAVVSCEYYFGGPLIGAKVEVSVSRSPAYDFEDEGEGDYHYGRGSGADYQSFNLVTDASGKAVVEFDTTPKDSSETQQDWDYSLTATVNEGEKYFEGEGTIRVNQGAYALEVRNESGFTEPNKPVAVTVFTRAHTDKSPVAGRKVRLTIGTTEWNDEVQDFNQEQTLDAVTDSNGGATVSFTPRAEGTYLIKGSSTDDDGHEVQAEAPLYVEGGPYFVGAREQAFEVTLDQRKYKVGQTAKALIRSSKTGLSALMTIEADHVLWSKVVKLDNVCTEIEIPVLQLYAPNAFVTVSGIKDKTFLQSQTNLTIDDVRRQLKIQVTPDRPNHRPGDRASYAVHTTDEGGKPVSADVSLAVVDESIYAIREDSTDPLSAFYPERQNNVDTEYSFPDLYLDGGDKGGHIPIRRKFQDTAAWSPDVQTNANGDATVSVNLPDNLTQWRTTCVGVSDDTRVGMGKCDLRASKPLMIRIETPMFVTVGDKLAFSAIVQNDTGKDADVHVQLDPSGVDVSGEHSQTVHIASGRPQTIEWTLDANKAGDAKLTAKAWIDGGDSDGVEQIIPVNPAGLIVQERHAEIAKGLAKLNVGVDPAADRNFGRLVVSVSPSLAQAMFQSLDDLIGYPYGCTEQTMSRFLPAILVQHALKGAPSPRPDLTKMIPQIADESLARLKRMQHSDGGWGWWIYDHSDEFMTAYVLDGLHRAKQAGYAVNQFMIDKAVKWAAKAVPELAYQPQKDDTKEEIAYMQAEIRREKLYLGFALAENGDKEGAVKAISAYEPSKADAMETAYAALLFEALGRPEAGAALQRLKGLAKTEGDMASWSAGHSFWNLTEPSAIALTALAEHDPKDPMVGMAVRYLMRSRQGEWWYTTRDTAFALIGLSDYLVASGELAQPQDVTVLVNGQAIKTLKFSTGSVTAPETRIEIPLSQLKAGDNSVEVRNGGGVTYFGTDLREAVAPQGANLVGNDSGLKIERKFYRMEARTAEDGTMRLRESLTPVDQVKSGDILECKVTIKADRPREFVMIEVPVPANCRVSDTDVALQDVDWSNWWSQTVIRDDRVSFFMRDLPTQEQTVTFMMRAEADGTATAGPATGGNMYDPAQSSHSQPTGLGVAKS